jgi:hypothetical protein
MYAQYTQIHVQIQSSDLELDLQTLASELEEMQNTNTYIHT